jgi:hypothetical protein
MSSWPLNLVRHVPSASTIFRVSRSCLVNRLSSRFNSSLPIWVQSGVATFLLWPTSSASGPKYTFCRDWDISHGHSSPHHRQSNGYAESVVKSEKKLIAGSWTSVSFDRDKLGKALLLFRNAPIAGSASPS